MKPVQSEARAAEHMQELQTWEPVASAHVHVRRAAQITQQEAVRPSAVALVARRAAAADRQRRCLLGAACSSSLPTPWPLPGAALLHGQGVSLRVGTPEGHAVALQASQAWEVCLFCRCAGRIQAISATRWKPSMPWRPPKAHRRSSIRHQSTPVHPQLRTPAWREVLGGALLHRHRHAQAE